jgi:ATP-dependent RNA helicase UAP56/SUB2
MENLKMFVLDECDKLLDSSRKYSTLTHPLSEMRGDIQKIFTATPHNKQVMMFTATLSTDIKDVCRKFMRNPTEVLIENESRLTLHGLKQYYVELKADEKIKKLMDLIDSLDFNQIIIFVKSVAYAIKLAEILNKSNFPSKAIHSGLKQEER